MDFKTRLRELRLSNKLTQADLAKKINVATSTISMYEQGQREPDLDKLDALCDYFNVDSNYMLGKTFKTTILPTNVYRPLNEDEKNLLKNYNNSNTRGRKIILDTSNNISKAYPYISREDMIAYLEEFQMAAWNGEKNLNSLSYEELEEKYYRIKEDFGDDK